MDSDINHELASLQRGLEGVKIAADDIEYWSARDLMSLLNYQRWESFVVVIDRAIKGCEQLGVTADDHFRQVPKMISLGKGARRLVDDYLLTRYACYLVAQNGDPAKTPIAAAQAYFAVQTRKQEVQEAEPDPVAARLEARQKLKATESKIERTVYQRGIKLPVEFATFKDKHIQALYGGLATNDLKRLRNIPKYRALADFDSHVELKAKDLALAMTTHNIEERDMRGGSRLVAEVQANSVATRDALLARDIRPENLSPQEDIKKIERRQKSLERKIAKQLSNGKDNNAT